jgi:hypothetical protein
MDDEREQRELADRIRDIQRNGDVIVELAKEIRHRELLEHLVIALLDRITVLETILRQHQQYHNYV